jgi:hypothetical protein
LDLPRRESLRAKIGMQRNTGSSPALRVVETWYEIELIRQPFLRKVISDLLGSF